ncbi:MAG: choloylglycine hydrolase family protein [Planctomycetia bacterium]|nr:choloylglycine hydrolase family protein [Planctomycetia bacterium]
MKSLRIAFVLACLVSAAALCRWADDAAACTDARVVAKDGSVVTGRTMEFGIDMQSRLIVQPRGAKLTSPAPGGKQGLTWEVKYGFVFLDALQTGKSVDGLNEAGLGIGALYLPNLGKYADVEPSRREYALSNLQFCAWALSRFATVDELRKEVQTVSVWGEPVAQLNDTVMPVHYVVHDASGKSIVLEWIDGKLSIYDNLVGVMTNCPSYDWHLTNLRNFSNLSPFNTPPLDIGGESFTQIGQGSGLIGLPGDPTPPSRFVCTALALKFSAPVNTDAEALVLVQKVINRVDIPRGLTRVKPDSTEGDYTQWAVFRDHTQRILYWRTYDNMSLRAVDLRKLDLTPGAPRRALPLDPDAGKVQFLSTDALPIDKAAD